ncbi:4-hydroxybenzoate octaprenyltransferase [Rickettsiales bacterium]|nr:4-hydroxybenzoate octaprenyltransferase [Rickettsiales bacterium]
MLVARGYADALIAIKFTIGAFSARSAGCIINDIMDLDIDKFVERTKDRPLASGKITVMQALLLLIILGCISVGILITTNLLTITIGLLAIIPIGLYPLMKRITDYPQVFLGFTFNLGAIIGGTAIIEKVNMPILSAYLGFAAWTIGYDTIYGYQDKKYDIKLGLKSTAITFKAKKTISYLYHLACIMWLIAGIVAKLNYIFYILLFVVWWFLGRQVNKLNEDNSEECAQAFKFNVLAGLLLLMAIALGRI